MGEFIEEALTVWDRIEEETEGLLPVEELIAAVAEELQCGELEIIGAIKQSFIVLH